MSAIIDSELLIELQTDPANLGYSVNGVLRPTSELSAMLGAHTTIPNPNPQGVVSAPIGVTTLFSKLSPTSQSKLEQFPSLAPLLADVASQNRAGLQLWASLLVNSSIITSGEAMELLGLLTTTISDPAWKPSGIGPSRIETLWGAGVIRSNQIMQVLGRASG